jgi:hypothetical protein
VARSPDDFVTACEEAIAADDTQARRQRSEAMAGESWEAKVAELGRWVRAAQERRAGHGETSPPAPDAVAAEGAGAVA